MNKEKIQDFRDLNVWKEAHSLVLQIYEITKNFPEKEIFSLTSQMRRAAVSITSNIAEGFGRHTFKDKVHFYYISQGSLLELKNQIIIAKDIKYIDLKSFNLLMEQASLAHKILQGLITKSKTFLNHDS